MAIDVVVEVDADIMAGIELTPDATRRAGKRLGGVGAAGQPLRVRAVESRAVESEVHKVGSGEARVVVEQVVDAKRGTMLAQHLVHGTV